MRKAINFDIDTKKYEEYTNRKSPTAYYEIKKFLKKSGFEHRQGSGYVSTTSMSESDIFLLVDKMVEKLDWIEYSIKEIDVTNIGKQHSLISTINEAYENSLSNIEM